MFATEEEEIFFMSHLTNNHRVLEYGSGYSTIEVSNKVKEIISIEHQKEWFEKIKLNINENSSVYLLEPNLPYNEGGHCGTYEEFRDYIEFPIKYGPYDIILIDGRARVHCSSICSRMSHNDTLIFVHDCIREEYKQINDYLELIDVAKEVY